MTKDHKYVLSVVVGTLNRLDRLRECIESIIRETSIPIKIYVTDAGSTDGTVEYLKKLNPELFHVILHEKKIGQAKAYNEIFSQITTPYTCWISDDNIVVNNSLETAVNILNSKPGIGMVGLKTKDMQGPFVREAYIGGISEAGILNVNQGVLRTEIIHKLGGFSEEFMDYGIDPDLTARVLFAGHQIVYTKKIAILHWRDWGDSEVLSGQMAKQDRYKALYNNKYLKCGAIPHHDPHLSRQIAGIKHILSKIATFTNCNKLNFFARDIYNIILSKYISYLDPISFLFKTYHLRQRVDQKTLASFSEWYGKN